MILASAGSVRLACVLVSLSVTLTSCRVTSQSVTDSMQPHSQERLEVIYRAHPAAGQMVSSDFTSHGTTNVTPVAAEVSDPIPFQNLNWSKAELRIVYPHPAGRTDWARVSLHFRPVNCGQECACISWGKQIEERVGDRQSRRATFRERWLYEPPCAVTSGETFPEIDLPKDQLDSILAELNSHGFFTDQGHPSDAESQLEVRVNRRWTSKRWAYEPALDALMTRTYEEGTVKAVALQPPCTNSARSTTSWLMPFGRSQ